MCLVATVLTLFANISALSFAFLSFLVNTFTMENSNRAAKTNAMHVVVQISMALT